MKIITISGASGSGKTTLADLIHKSIPNSLLLSLDRYYLSKVEQIEKNGFCNFDYPTAIDVDRLKEDLLLLKQNGEATVPKYDFTISQRAGYEKVSVNDAIIIEGLFAGALLNDESDLTIFVDVDMDLALLRRIQRDLIERGRTIASITEQYLNYVRPAYFEHIEKIKTNSDVVIKNNRSTEELIKETQKVIELVNTIKI